MSVHLFDGSIAGNPAEPLLLEALTVRLIEDSEREHFDEELVTKHYLKNAHAVGRVLRYVAEYRGQWVALVMFNSPAFHIKLRDQWPNLASRVLKLVCERLPQDWRQHFGYPVRVVETFVDPQRFRGTCYKAAGWQQLGPTRKGRCRQLVR